MPEILGIGCVTALGNSPAEILANAGSGKCPAVERIPDSVQGGSWAVYRAELSDAIVRNVPRLRRSSRISHLACAAVEAAVARVPDFDPTSCAMVFAASNGAVIYTRMFYAQVVAEGTGSPMLFPETVYNAPASHVAAMLGIDGEVLTMVGDATAGTQALGLAAEILEAGPARFCLVVAAEEVDAITCEAYRRWGLVKDEREHSKGIVLAEGAVALLLGKDSSAPVRLEAVHPGASYFRGRPLRAALDGVVSDLCAAGQPDAVIPAAAGTRFDRLESAVLEARIPGARCLAPNRVGGQAFAVSTLLQTVVGAGLIEHTRARRVLVSVPGWNGQVGGLVLTGRTGHA